MKTLALLALCLAPTLAHAQKYDIDAIFEKGANAFRAATNDYFLNPIYCMDVKSEEIVLVYSKDFREGNVAYLLSQGRATKVNPSVLALTERTIESTDNYQGYAVDWNRTKLICAESRVQLE